MKPMTLIWLGIFILTIGLALQSEAGPAMTSGPAQPDSGGSGGVYAPTTLSTTSGVSPGLNANSNAAASSGGTSQPAGPATNSSNSAGPAIGTSSSSQNAGTSTTQSGSANAPTVTELKQEKVAEVSEKDLASQREKNQNNKSEVTKKFESSLLDQGIDKIAQPQGGPVTSQSTAARPGSGQQNQQATSGQNSPERN